MACGRGFVEHPRAETGIAAHRVGNPLQAAVGQANVVGALGVVAPARLLVPELDAACVVVDSVEILVLGVLLRTVDGIRVTKCSRVLLIKGMWYPPAVKYIYVGILNISHGQESIHAYKHGHIGRRIRRHINFT